MFNNKRNFSDCDGSSGGQEFRRQNTGPQYPQYQQRYGDTPYPERYRDAQYTEQYRDAPYTERYPEQYRDAPYTEQYRGIPNDTERSPYAQQLTQLQAENKCLVANLTRCEEALAKTQGQLIQAEEENVTLVRKTSLMVTQIQDRKAELEKQQQEHEAYMQKLRQDHEAKMQKLQHDGMEKDKAIAALGRRNTLLNANHQRDQERYNSTSMENSTLKAENARLTAEITTFKADKTQVLEEKEALKTTYTRRLKEEMNEHTAEVNKLTAEKTALKTEISWVNQEKEQLEEHMKEDIDDLKEKNQDLFVHNKALLESIGKMTVEITGYKNSITLKDAELAMQQFEIEKQAGILGVIKGVVNSEHDPNAVLRLIPVKVETRDGSGGAGQ